MSICIGAPISRDRAWILPRYLAGIYNQNYNKEDIHLAFLVNGKQKDNTSCLIQKFKEDFGDEYSKMDIWYLDNDKENSRECNSRDYEYFAEIRNLFIGMRRNDDTHIFSIDSDIVLDEQNTLNKLLEHDKPIISALIWNGSMGGGYDQYNILNKTDTYVRGELYYQTLPMSSPPRLRKIDATGACCLIDCEVIDDGVRYEKHFQGEDLGFCSNAQKQGYPIYCDENIQPRHFMEMNSNGKNSILC